MRSWLCPPSRPSSSSPFSLVELRAPVDQLADVLGRLADDHLDDLAIAQPGAGDERVVDVVLEAVLGLEHAGDAALGVGAVGLLAVVSLVTTSTDSRGSIAIAARSPAMPPPMTSTSAKWCGIRLGWKATR